jgi:hypothetical protein
MEGVRAELPVSSLFSALHFDWAIVYQFINM